MDFETSFKVPDLSMDTDLDMSSQSQDMAPSDGGSSRALPVDPEELAALTLEDEGEEGEEEPGDRKRCIMKSEADTTDARARGMYLVAGAPGKATLKISCAKLKNMDLLSLSDPFVVIEKKSCGVWTECARTEVQGQGLTTSD